MKRFLILSLIVLGLLGLIVKKKLNHQEAKLITFSVDNQIKSFDPAIAFNDDALFVLGQSLETLYQYHYLKRPFEVIPSLADGLPEVSSDGRVYKIKIKKDIKYHNFSKVLPPERTVKSDDFILQIKRLAFNPLKSNGRWLFEGRIEGFEEFSNEVGDDLQKLFSTPMKGLKKIDDYSFEIHLKEPSNNLLYFLCMPFTAPTPIETVQKYQNNLAKIIEGTGPYRYLGLEENIYRFRKFEEFREEYYPTSGDRYANAENLLVSSREKLPFIQNIEIKVFDSEEAKWEAFMAGELDILPVPKKRITEVINTKSETYKDLLSNNIIIKHFSRQTTRWLAFNMNDPVLGKNINLRKAIAHAIDYELYLKIISNNTNLRANSIFNPSIKGYNPNHFLPYKYDLKKAKKYLEKSAIDLDRFVLNYSTRGKQDIHRDEALFIKEQLSRIGIKVKINEITFSEFLRDGRAGNLQFFTDNWIYDYPDAENLLQLLISQNHPGINKSGFSNSRVDELYFKLNKAQKHKEKLEYMHEIEKIVEQEIPWILLMYESTYILQQEQIQNFRKSFFIRNYVKYLKK